MSDPYGAPRVLVVCATAFGSTAGIAAKVGDSVRRAGFAVDVRSPDEVGALDPYDAVIVGSAIHDQQWLAPAAEFLRTRRSELSTRPVWLFSVCSVGETTSFVNARVARAMRRWRKDPAAVSDAWGILDVRGHRYFAGAIARAHWTTGGHLFLRLCGGRYGDHRDWADVEQWATGIARSLGVAAVSASR